MKVPAVEATRYPSPGVQLAAEAGRDGRHDEGARHRHRQRHPRGHHPRGHCDLDALGVEHVGVPPVGETPIPAVQHSQPIVTGRQGAQRVGAALGSRVLGIRVSTGDGDRGQVPRGGIHGIHALAGNRVPRVGVHHRAGDETERRHGGLVGADVRPGGPVAIPVLRTGPAGQIYGDRARRVGGIDQRRTCRQLVGTEGGPGEDHRHRQVGPHNGRVAAQEGAAQAYQVVVSHIGGAGGGRVTRAVHGRGQAHHKVRAEVEDFQLPGQPHHCVGGRGSPVGHLDERVVQDIDPGGRVGWRYRKGRALPRRSRPGC